MTPEIKKNPAIAKRVEEIALALGQVRSVVDTPGEIDAANKVYEIFSQMDYWKEHPENLYFVPVKDDPIGRKSCTAILELPFLPSRMAVQLLRPSGSSLTGTKYRFSGCSFQ